jgi:uncharacterized membrane protein YobD (UPF0266 family)
MVIVGRAFPKKPFFRVMVSSLGERIRHGHRFFNHIVSILGILTIPMVYIFYLTLPKNLFTFLGLFFLLVGCVSTFL